MAVSRPLPLLVALLVGIAVGAGGATLLTPTDRTTSPTFATQAGTGCAADQERPGWVGQFADDDQRHVLLNVTFEHESPGVDLEYDLEEVGAGKYRFAITTAPTTEKGDPPADCQPRTTLQASISLPGDFDMLEIMRDGTIVTTVRNTGESFPSFRVLSGTRTN